MQSAWALIGVLFALVVVMNLLTPRRTRQRRRPSRTSRRIDAAVGASPQTVRRPKRTTFVTDEEWRAFGEVKAGITGAKGEDAVKRELARLGLTALHDVILSDSRGLTQVDHLVLGSDGIFVLETKTYGGFITGGLHAPTLDATLSWRDQDGIPEPDPTKSPPLFGCEGGLGGACGPSPWPCRLGWTGEARRRAGGRCRATQPAVAGFPTCQPRSSRPGRSSPRLGHPGSRGKPR